MSIKVNIRYPDDIEELQRKAADILSSILVKKIKSEEINELIEILKDDSNKITC